MCAIRRQTFPLVLGLGLLASALGWTAAASAQTPAKDLADLAGSWQTEKAESAERDGSVTEINAEMTLEGEWLELRIGDTEASGRHAVETLMLRQASNGSVTAYAFTAGQQAPRELTGAWTAGGKLELRGNDAEETWIWRWESACEMVLEREMPTDLVVLRPMEIRLSSAACAEDPQTPVVATDRSSGKPSPVNRDGRPPDAKPGTAEQTGAEPAGALGEVEVADLPAARAPAASSEGGSHLVILAGRGKPLDEVQKTVARLRAFLEGQGVTVEGPSDDIVVLQEGNSSLAYLVRQVRDRKAASLLYVTAAYGGRERVVVDCYTGDGLVLWQERIVGGTGMRKFKWMNAKLVERMEQRLLTRLGGPGLPVTGDHSP